MEGWAWARSVSRQSLHVPENPFHAIPKITQSSTWTKLPKIQTFMKGVKRSKRVHVGPVHCIPEACILVETHAPVKVYDLHAGDVLIFESHVPHGSTCNFSEDFRYAQFYQYNPCVFPESGDDENVSGYTIGTMPTREVCDLLFRKQTIRKWVYLHQEFKEL